MRAKHRCPGCRAVDVHNTMLACLACWRLLPGDIQREVTATVGYPLLHKRRAAALQAAIDSWRR